MKRGDARNRNAGLSFTGLNASMLLWALWQAPALGADDAETRYIEVMPGDSLYAIVRDSFPDHSSAWTLISRDIVRLNPDAFRNGDPGSLRVGATLQLPNVSGQAPPPRVPMRVPPDAAQSTTTPDANGDPEPDAAQQPPAPVTAPPLVTIGEVIDAPGRPVAIDLARRERRLGAGSKVFLGDELHSGNEGSLRIMMNDGAEVLLRPFSQIAIDEYTFIESRPEASRSTIRLLSGGLRTITGLIGRRSPDGFRLLTQVGVIGVHGTDFGVRVCVAGGCTIAETLALGPGVYTGVLDGEIVLSNDAGSVAVMRGEFVHTRAIDVAPEPAPEAATVVFSSSELAVLEPETGKPMNFFQWLRYRITGND